MSLTLDEEEQLAGILTRVEPEELKGWDKSFFLDISARYQEEGAALFVSGKMWKNLNRIGDKF